MQAETWATLPAEFRRTRRTPWADVNAGRELDSFLEGPAFDRHGNLFVCDIPNGRIFSIDAQARWTLVAEYDGWPNGLSIHADGRLFIADHARGLLVLEAGASRPEVLLDTWRSERFKGLNDLCFGTNGDLFFTDQGQTGLHDSTGRVFRLGGDGTLRCLLGNAPSPNGLCLSLDERQLYVAMTRGNCVWRLPLMADGGVSKVGLFLQLSGGLAGPDGLALDAQGGLIVAHPGLTVWRFDARGRRTHHVGALHDTFITNIAFSGATLYMLDAHRGEISIATMPVPGRALYSHQTR